MALADACGRILAEDIIADTDLPPFDRAQMDGYAGAKLPHRAVRESEIDKIFNRFF